MKAFLLGALLLPGSLVYADCFPKAVEPGVELNVEPHSSQEKPRYVHVLAIDGCWIQFHNCSVAYGEEDYMCAVEKPYWLYVDDLTEFRVMSK